MGLVMRSRALTRKELAPDWRWAALAVMVLVVASAAAPTAADAAIVRVHCEGCDEWPVWVQALLVLAGLGLAMAVLYIPVRLSNLAKSPRNRSRIMIGGVVLALVALIAGARALVILFPD